MELEIFEALTAVNVPADKAKAVAESINSAIDRRYSLHSQQLATRGDIAVIQKDMAEMETRLLKALTEMQRWTLTALFGGLGALAISKYNYDKNTPPPKKKPRLGGVFLLLSLVAPPAIERIINNRPILRAWLHIRRIANYWR